MKTTFDIASNILTRSRMLAKREHVALKGLVEEGLLLVIERHESRPAKTVQPVTFRGHGLSREYSGASWSEVRDAAYAGHGA